MAITALCAAAFAGAFTSVRTEGSNIAFSCMISFWQNAFYGVLYAYGCDLTLQNRHELTCDRYTPEVMPTAVRGTGAGFVAACGRVASLSSPMIATFADLTTSVPIWACLGLYVFIALIALVLPYEPRNFEEEERF